LEETNQLQQTGVRSLKMHFVTIRSRINVHICPCKGKDGEVRRKPCFSLGAIAQYVQVTERPALKWPLNSLGVFWKEYGVLRWRPFSPPGLNNLLPAPLHFGISLLLFSQPVFNLLLWLALTVTSTQSEGRG
jgi:hypothetical protein